MNKSRSSHDNSREVTNKLDTSWELAEALKDLKTTILGGWVAQAMWRVAQATWSGLRRLCGGSTQL